MGEETEDQTLRIVSRLLYDGGDDRTIVDPSTSTNKYGCAPFPSSYLQFGSSTASSVSSLAFEASKQLYLRVASKLSTTSVEEALSAERGRIIKEIRSLFVGESTADYRVIIDRSGTDIHYNVAERLQSDFDPVLIIMFQSSETGSGVPHALSGHRRELWSSLNLKRRTQLRISSHLFEVRLRNYDGTLLPMNEVDRHVFDAVEIGLQKYGRVLLVALDQSKTGIVAPSPFCLESLRQTYERRVTVLVDACQARLCCRSISNYLSHDCLVALTGSKFMGGPAFSGALLVPETIAGSLNRKRTALSQFGQFLPDSANFALLMRWEAALCEVRRFRAAPQDKVHGFVLRFEKAMTEFCALEHSMFLAPHLPVRRDWDSRGQQWDEARTIFSVGFLRDASVRIEEVASTDAIARSFAEVVSQMCRATTGKSRSEELEPPVFRLGQPVFYGTKGGIDTSVVRLSLSAGLICEAIDGGSAAENNIIKSAFASLLRVASYVKSHSC